MLIAIGTKIKCLRVSLKLTQEELASAIGTKKQTIHKYETGIISNIPASKIKALADKLQTTPAYLMGWADDEETEKKNDTITDIILKLRSDSELLKIVKDICELSPEQQADVLVTGQLSWTKKEETTEENVF